MASIAPVSEETKELLELAVQPANLASQGALHSVRDLVSKIKLEKLKLRAAKTTTSVLSPSHIFLHRHTNARAHYTQTSIDTHKNKI